MNQFKKGFTFLEVILAMAIVSTVSVMIMVNYSGQKPARDLASAKQKITAVLRDASARSLSQGGGVSWSVRFSAGSPTSSFFALYSGAYSSSSVVSFSPLPTSLRFDTSTFGGGSTKDVSFISGTGKPSASTSVRIVVAGNSLQFSSIQIASSGLISLDPISNLAQGKSANQISTGWGGVASRAVDGNTDGNFWNNSVSHTQTQTQDWWEVDLGQTYTIDTINIWNRTDYCINYIPVNCLNNYYILISPTPFSGSLATILATPGVWSSFQVSEAGRPTAITANQLGRYVRVQRNLSGNPNYLQLAEVEVLGR